MYPTLTLLCVSPLSRQAEGFKEQGNAFYSQKDYSEAFNYYTKAIGEITKNSSLSLELCFCNGWVDVHSTH